MNEDELKALFEQHKADREAESVPSSAKKQQTIALAMAEFDAEIASRAQAKNKFSNFFQGIFNSWRLTGTSKPPEEKTMKSPAPWAFGGVATAVVVVFAVLIVDFDRHENRPDSISDEKKSVELAMPAAPPSASIERDEASTGAVEEEIVVTDVRAKLKRSMAEKTEPSSFVDSIQAEDIARSTDQEIAAVLARETGVAVLSEASEGARMTLRGAELSSKGIAPRAEFSSVRAEPMPNDPITEATDKFEQVDASPIKRVSEAPVSTFSIDVDTASYSFVRSALNNGRLPPKDAVRIEEMVNYFDYNYPLPDTREQPFRPNVSVIDSPWAKGKKLMHLGIKGFDVPAGTQPRSNLVFLLDVSGSMNQSNKLPLVKQSMSLLLSKLEPNDTVAIAVYAGAAGTVLEPTPVSKKTEIMAALNRLQAGGSTAGAQGIELAYQLAEANFDKNAVNRVILATDGDFNVGVTDHETLKGLIERKRDKGIFLSVLGFGRGNYNDQMMQTLAQNGNGVAAYIDSLSEAQKVLVDEATSTLFPIAKDVKIQVEFNLATVSEYRLIGYETRALKREDFNNDKVDAGDIGAGHTVTAIYEITPVASGAESVDELRYQAEPKADKSIAGSAEYAFLKVRYKLPDEDVSKLLTTVVPAANTEFSNDVSGLRSELEFSVSVAGFAQLLKNSVYLGDWGLENALELAQANRGEDEFGYRAEFVQLIRKAQVASDL